MSKSKKPPTLADELRSAITASDLTLYRIAKDAGIHYASLLRFVAKERDLRLESAGAIAAVLGLHLAPIRGR